MSLDVSTLSAYVDENKMELIKKSILQGRTMDFVQIQADIKSSATINIIDSDIVGQAGGCGYNPLGSTILSQRELSVDSIKVNESTCLDVLEGFYTQTQMNKGSYNEEIPFEAIYAELKSEKIANMLEEIVWKGDTDIIGGNLSLANGFFKVIDAESTTIDGNTTAATDITPANVIDLVNGMVSSIPVDVINADDLILYVGYDTYRLYSRALIEANLYHFNGVENQGGEFMQFVPGTNVKIVAFKGINGTDRMVLSRQANLYVGVDMLNDYEDFSIFYSMDNQEVRFVSKFKVGTQIAFPSLLVEYKNA